MKKLNLIIRLEHKRNNETRIVPFAIGDSVEDPERALRDAVRDFVHSNTDEAKSALEYACGSFNWGDVMSSIPNEYFVKHGLTPIDDDESIEVMVDHDEILDDRETLEDE